MTATALLTFEDVHITRGGQPALSVDELDICRGETLAVIGPNGAGKSTLLLTAAGLLAPSAGSLTKDGQVVYAGDLLAYRRKVALVLQDPLLLDQTVFCNVASGLRFRGLPRKEIQRRVTLWLERLGIAHLSKRSAHSLSGGEAQRTSLARALALEPDLLLLDEPFSALDAPTRMRLLEDFRSLVKENPVTALLVTHDLNEALQLGDRVAVLLEGRLRQTGAPAEVFNAPNAEDVAAFVGVDTVISAQVTASDAGMLTLRAGAYDLQAVGEVPTGREVLLCLRPEDITLWSNGDVPASSARNRMQGVVTRTAVQGALVRVTVDCGFPVVSLITRSSWMEMALHGGSRVSASFKASAGHILSR